jgi:outer membrane lipoprotein-sorting protein
MRQFPAARPLGAMILALGLGCAIPSAGAAPVSPAATTSIAGEQTDIARIEAFLNGLTTATADFTFVAPDGQVSRGTFYLDRPSRLRFDYADPKGNLLIADGDYVIYWDAAQKDQSNLPIDSTPLAFLLKPHISLSDGVTVTRYEHAAGAIRVTLAQAKDPGAGSVTVAFADQPIELRGWRLIDGQGQITDVTFQNWKFGMTLDSALFHFTDPNSGKRHR